MSALQGHTTGSGNIALGVSAGIKLTSGDDNVYIASKGASAESGTIRIGKGVHTATFIASKRASTSVACRTRRSSSGSSGWRDSFAQQAPLWLPSDFRTIFRSVEQRSSRMIRVKLTSIMVDDQAKARRFYTEKLGFRIKHDIPIGEAFWLTLTAPDDPDGVELLLEPIGHPAAAAMQKALYADGIPLTQLYTADIAEEHARLVAKGVAFKDAPKPVGPTRYADFDDTCGNLIRLVQG